MHILAQYTRKLGYMSGDCNTDDEAVYHVAVSGADALWTIELTPPASIRKHLIEDGSCASCQKTLSFVADADASFSRRRKKAATDNKRSARQTGMHSS